MPATGIQIPLEAGPSSLLICSPGLLFSGIPSILVAKNLPAGAGDISLIPGLGRFPWKRKWQPTPFLLGNPMDRGACWATVQEATKSQTQLSMHTCPFSTLTFLSVYICNE